MAESDLETAREQAVALHRRGEYGHAMKRYRGILRRYPDDVPTLSNLGAVYRGLKKPEAAVPLYRRALKLENSSGVLLNLANALKDAYYFDAALEVYRTLLSREERYHYRFNLAVAYREQGEHERALDVLQPMLRRDSKNAAIQWELAQNYLRLGEYTLGWKYFEARWHIGKLSLPSLKLPIWKAQSLAGKHLLVVAEQGYGDTMLMARYLPEVVASADTVTLLCKPELHGLFRDTGVHCISSRSDAATLGADYMTAIMSLPGILDPRGEQLPPPFRFHVDERRQLSFSELARPAPFQLNVAIVWSGSVTFENNHARSVSLSRMLKWLIPFDVNVFSLQKGDPLSELYDAGLESVITDVGSQCNDFSDTAAALQQMDCVVMTDSSLAHLGASLNKPVINLLDWNSYWLYGASGCTTPWYPSMRLVRQKVPGEWSSVQQELTKALEELTAAKQQRAEGKATLNPNPRRNDAPAHRPA